MQALGGFSFLAYLVVKLTLSTKTPENRQLLVAVWYVVMSICQVLTVFSLAPNFVLLY